MGVNKNEQIIIPDEEGTEHHFNILYKFDIDATEKTYIVVVSADIDLEADDEEEVEIYAFRYEDNVDKQVNEDDFLLFEIETDEEWDMVEDMIYILDEQAYEGE